LRVDQIGIDVTARLVGPESKTLVEVDDPRGFLEPEVVSLIVEHAGDFRLEIEPNSPAARPGRYRVRIEELRPPGPGDVERLAAAGALAEGRRLYDRSAEMTRQSREYFRKALELYETAGDPEGQVEALLAIGDSHRALGEAKSAIPFCEKALALAEPTGYRRGEAAALKKLADAYALQPEHREKALALYARALVIWQELGEGGHEGSTLYGMALTYQSLGRPNEALDCAQRALPLRRVAGEMGGVANTLNILGLLEYDRGQINEAMKHLNEALHLSLEAQNQSAQAFAFFGLARIQRLRGDLEEALQNFRQSRDLNRRLGNIDYELSALNAMGSIYLDLGNAERALQHYEAALRLARDSENQFEVARTLNLIGWVLHMGGDHEAALDRYGQALPIAKVLNNSYLIALTLHDMGMAYTALRQLEPGLSSLLQALERRNESGDLVGQTLSHLGIGSAYAAKGDAELAAQHFHQACKLSHLVGNDTYESVCLYRWALLERDRGDLRQALEKAAEALSLVESVRSRVSSEKLRTSFFAGKRTYYELYVDLLMGLDQPEAAFEASERARARSLLDLFAEGPEGRSLRGGVAPELKQKEIELGDRLVEIQHQLGTQPGRDPERAAELREQLRHLQGELERLEAEVRQRFARYAAVRYPQPLSLADVRDLLDEQTALLQYFVGKEGSWLFVVTRNGLASYPLPAAADLSEHVEALRKLLTKGSPLSVGSYRHTAWEAFNVLLGPASETLRRHPHLLIAPDAVLHFLPFEALVNAPGQGSKYSELPYLLKTHVVSYVPSASVLAELRESRSDGTKAGVKQFLAFADPVVGSDEDEDATALRDGANLTRLQETQREVEAIARLYPEGQSEIYLGVSATEARVKNLPSLKTARRIHFATHGVLDPLPQLSGLVLTQDGSTEDGRLRVYEIFNLELNADLVALSACETGLGQEVPSEGIVGLTRAFLYAGGRSVLVSLWKVPDLSTPVLMESFYRNLGSMSKADALRSSKIQMIEDGGYAQPYFWAPFVLAGNPR
jgi:CHAT domain-containing protein/predicted negative regulator of RcsB-dependent stress response